MKDVGERGTAPNFSDTGVAVRRAMANIVRLAVLRTAPFSSLPPATCLTRFEAILRNKHPKERQAHVDAFIKFMEFTVSDHLVEDEQALKTWDAVAEEAMREYVANYSPPQSPPVQITMRDSKKIIRGSMRARAATFSYEGSGSGIMRFVRPAPTVNLVVLEFDMGSFGSGHFNVGIGTRGPDYLVELGTLLCLAKRDWNYSDAGECTAAVSQVCDLIAILMPALDDALRDLRKSR